MNKQDIYNYLNNKNIAYEKIEHKAVYTMAEINEIKVPYPEAEAKNIFVRDDKKKNYYLITIKGNKKVNLKEFSKINNTRHLSFASSEDLMDILKLTPGSVTPLGLLNDINNRVIFYLDEEFLNSIIGIHPNDNTATIVLKTEELINIIEENGNQVNITKI